MTDTTDNTDRIDHPGTRRDNLETLFDVVVGDLTQRIKNGEAKAADLSVAAKLCQDNNIGLDANTAGMQSLTNAVQKAKKVNLAVVPINPEEDAG